MPMKLQGSCRCGTVRFTLDSHTPVPYQLCYCSICRKTTGGGGFAINIMGVAESLEVIGEDAIAVYRAEIEQDDGSVEISSGERSFCSTCGSALWLYDENWPDLIHPLAAVIDTPLPKALEKVHLMLDFKPEWVDASIGPKDQTFARYPEQSIEEWHRSRGLWID
ncbi:GFA family protein [Lichenihabitans psoromatis]|uniref:GFA family protein n=1 Tax=Lichenihabitans psoromatis TaxID=2528642 RepID=UPI00103838F8|nr:GFA family protein [Lichenihabitans psoromatis]